MPILHAVRPDTYYDSVFLMALASKLGALPGIARAAVLMASPANQELLVEFGLSAEALAGRGAMDLVLAVEAADPAQAEAALSEVDGLLQHQAEQDGESTVATLEGALHRLPTANLALISVPGEFAAFEARRALERGLNVFLFSDNVTVEDEVALKEDADRRGLLVMGPDCGTALIGGVGLGFANVVRRGSIGIVGPSGTGIQQVSSLIDAGGGGVSHAIGTGGRDLSDAVCGRSTLRALDALAADAETRVILLVAKPAGAATKRRVLDWIATTDKPVVTCFLGPEPTAAVAPNHLPARTLAEAATLALRLDRVSDAGEGDGTNGAPDNAAPAASAMLAETGLHLEQVHVRGLFAGGTFCYEAQQVFRDAGLNVGSNAPLPGGDYLADPPKGQGDSMVDLGDDRFTRGRPHPMIDASLRNACILAEAADSTVAVLLLDFILGFGAAPDPAGDAAPALREALRRTEAAGRTLTIVASVCGTDADPQHRAGQEAILAELGVLVAGSNAGAAALAAAIARRRRGLVPLAPPRSDRWHTVGKVGLARPIGNRPDAQPAPLLMRAPAVVALGVRLFTTALQEQEVPVVHVEWTPPAGGDKAMLDLLSELL